MKAIVKPTQESTTSAEPHSWKLYNFFVVSKQTKETYRVQEKFFSFVSADVFIVPPGSQKQVMCYSLKTIDYL